MRRFAYYHDDYDWTYAEAKTPEEAKKECRLLFNRLRRRILKGDGNAWEMGVAAKAKFSHGEFREIGQQRHRYGPRPKCCRAINKNIKCLHHEGPAVLLKVLRYDRKKDKQVPDIRWEIAGIGLVVTHCPFCGTKLPKVEKKKKPPKPIYVPDDKEGHCLTCDSDDHGWCQCNPASAGYRIIP